jgi:hypothetical protein
VDEPFGQPQPVRQLPDGDAAVLRQQDEHGAVVCNEVPRGHRPLTFILTPVSPRPAILHIFSGKKQQCKSLAPTPGPGTSMHGLLAMPPQQCLPHFLHVF